MRTKYIGGNGLPMSVSLYQQPLTNDPNDNKTLKTADGITESHDVLFKIMKVDQKEIDKHFKGLHGDGQVKKFQIASKVQKKYNIMSIFSKLQDLAHMLEIVFDRVKENSMWVQVSLSVNKSITNVFRKSLKSRNWLKTNLTEYFYVSMPSYSDTKFVAHLSKSFKSYFRDFIGIISFFNTDLSCTRKVGRRNLGMKNLAQSAGHQLSSRIINDSITQFITPLSTYAQSDLNPTYKS